jgi:hypothetical protein
LWKRRGAGIEPKYKRFAAQFAACLPAAAA